MNRKSLLIFLLAVIFTLPTRAVLKEKDLNSTLSILRTELTDYRIELERQSGYMKEQQKTITNNIISVLNQSNQNALMLYSQNSDYVFDLTYACNAATEQYRKFKDDAKPFMGYINRNKSEIARYDSLIESLRTMPEMSLSEKSKIDRNVCLTLAVNIRRTITDNSNQMADYVRFYDMADQRLRNLNSYANMRYGEIQANIFRNGGDNFFSIISHFGSNVKTARMSVSDKYKPTSHSQWNSKVIAYLFSIIILYAIVAIGINFLVIRLFLTRLTGKYWSKESHGQFLARRTFIIMAMAVVTFAMILGVVRFTVRQNFITMASDLLMEYAWLLGVILISLLLRLSSEQVKSGFRIYAPIIIVSFVVITFRIILIPNDLVNLIFPPILLICTLWQWLVIRRHNSNMPKSDVWYTYTSLVVFTASAISSWVGYTLLSVQFIIWWMMQLTCILTITCLVGWVKELTRRKAHSEQPIAEVLFYRFISNVILPVLGVGSVMLSIYWAADIFDMSDATWMIFNRYFIDSKGFSVSILTLSIVISLYIVFTYLNYLVKTLLAACFGKSDKDTAASRNIMAKNVAQIIVWGVWLLVSLSIFHVSNTWLVVVSGGLSTGVGFASKDILENIYYGISLMTGRIKIGDYIECEGTRGKVTSINYTSTTVETVTGAVISFQNNQLFTKSYKNMTRNHGYELDALEVGVAYGTDIARVRQLLVDAIMQVEGVYKEKGVKVILKEFAPNSIILKVIVWVPVLTQSLDDGDIMECIYNTLNKNNIDIPFPQTDVHIVSNASYDIS